MPAPLTDKLTIIIPVYNEKGYISAAVESCVAQAGRVIICDNASDDGTEETCKALAEKYPNVTHLRRQKNIGAFENMREALFSCETPYLSFIGSHDYIGPEYTSPILAEMEKDATVSLGIGTIQHVNEKGEKLGATRTVWLDKIRGKVPLDRVDAFVTKLRDCFMFYGIYRTADAKKAWFDTPCLGFDRAMLIRVAAGGNVIYIPRAIFYARNFTQKRDGLNDQERRVQVIAEKPVAKNLLARNKAIAETVLSLAHTPEQLSQAFDIMAKVNSRLQNRKRTQKRRLMLITGGVLMLAAFIAALVH